MNRKDFLKGLGLTGLATVVGSTVKGKTVKFTGNPPVCTLIPSETAGPYPLDLSGNSAMFRQDIREDQQGVQLDIKLKIIGDDNCEPMANARVDLWHCNALGYYSGYNTNGQNGSINYAGKTWLRGIQMTDAYGEVTFTSIFPGWYNGRIIHIHFQVFISSMLQVTSQLAFPVAEKNAVLAAHEPYSAYGDDPATFSSDNVFSDGYALQLATLTPNAVTGGYDSYLEVTINGTGTTGLRNLEPETGGQFKLLQNFPNPYSGQTTVPFTLKNTSKVRLELYDLSGKKVNETVHESLPPGEHSVALDMKALGMPSANYAYQLVVENSNGVFQQCKMMTAR